MTNIKGSYPFSWCSGLLKKKKTLKVLDLCLDFARDVFPVINKTHSDYNLKVLEILYIKSKQPSLSKQMCLLGLNDISVTFLP